MIHGCMLKTEASLWGGLQAKDSSFGDYILPVSGPYIGILIGKATDKCKFYVNFLYALVPKTTKVHLLNSSTDIVCI